jgi:MFS superfamily sulfate permease-like transporter
MMAVVSGSVCILAGLSGLGFITELLSKPIRYGYMNGIALAVLISQSPKLFGISLTSERPGLDVWHLVQALLAGRANWYSFAVGGGSLALILALKRVPRLPSLLIVMGLATLAVAGLDLSSHGVKVLGAVPQGLPSFALP